MAGNSTNQIFQTSSSSRWSRFIWSSRLIALFVVLGIITIIITLTRVYTPTLPLFGATEKEALLDSSSWLFNKSKIGKQYGGFRKFINEKVAYKAGGYPIPRRFKKKNGVIVQADSSFYSFKKFSAGVRAGFYVNWSPASFTSLEQNISRLNMVLPEWFFLDGNADTLTTKIKQKEQVDQKALEVMNKSGVKVLPLLTNNIGGVFHGEVVHRILNDTKKRDRLINDIIKYLELYKLDGINIDFEDLQEKKNEVLVQFQKSLYEKMHAKGLLVSQDVQPFNMDYNFEELSRYNDYVILMAYDQFSDGTGPGPIAHQRWIEGAVDETIKKIPADKLILAIAGFGYDWQLNNDQDKVDSVKPISYQDALTLARSFDGKIIFDNESYNLHFSYDGDDGAPHKVQFTDAATSFNSMRFAVESGLAGVALWRLGNEDSRMWDFYDHDMSKDSLRNFDFHLFTTVRTMVTDEKPDYSGEGEVLDVIGGPSSGKITPELDTTEFLISEESYDSLPSKWLARKYGTKDKKKLVLTFDDGPDPIYTPQILDILSREHVPAAFFIVGIISLVHCFGARRVGHRGHQRLSNRPARAITCDRHDCHLVDHRWAGHCGPASPGGQHFRGGRRCVDRLTMVYTVSGTYPHSVIRVLGGVAPQFARSEALRHWQRPRSGRSERRTRRTSPVGQLHPLWWAGSVGGPVHCGLPGQWGPERGDTAHPGLDSSRRGGRYTDHGRPRRHGERCYWSVDIYDGGFHHYGVRCFHFPRPPIYGRYPAGGRGHQ